MAGELCGRVEGAVAGYAGRAAVVLHEPAAGGRLAINEAALFPAASIIKLAVLWAFYRMAEAGAIDAGERIELPAQQRAGGTGVLSALDPGLRLTWRDVATLMITVSDNTATNLLIDRLTMARVNAEMAQLGLIHTRLRRRMMDSESAHLGLENETTAGETASLLGHLLNSAAISAPARQAILDIMKRQQLNDRLSRAWPEETIFAHKTGSLPGRAEHDAGILFAGERQVIVVVLTDGAGDAGAGPDLCAEVGRLVLAHYLPARER
jgi:beta-lactamase class A